MEQRLNNIRKSFGDAHVDINDRLKQCIDKLTLANQHDVKHSFVPANTTADEVKTASISSRREVAYRYPQKPVNDFSQHLKNCQQCSYNEDYIGAKLKRSTWEHLYNALSQAREGNETSARLHANIATQAMKEAHKYLEDDDYANFSNEIDRSLDASFLK